MMKIAVGFNIKALFWWIRDGFLEQLSGSPAIL